MREECIKCKRYLTFFQAKTARFPVSVDFEHDINDEFYIQPTERFIEDLHYEDFDKQNATEELLNQFRSELDDLMGTLGFAIRNNDEKRIEEIQGSMLDLRQRVRESAIKLEICFCNS